MTRYLFIDLDGTIEDSRQDMAEAVARVRRSLGLWPGDPAEHRQHVNRGMTELYRACFADHLGAGGDLEELRLAYERDYLDHVAVHTRLYAGMAEALPALAALGPVAVITNKPERISRALLGALGVAGAIADVIGGDTCAEGKPSPAPLRLAVARRGGAPGPAVMIGDSAADMRAARAFGAATIWCAWGYATTPGEDTPDFICAGAGELAAAARQALGEL